MGRTAVLDELILERIKDLPEKDKKEILQFIEFIKVKEDRFFIEYVNKRTEEALEARKRGKHFTSLEALQKEYAK